jgi:hypothetical protein
LVVELEISQVENLVGLLESSWVCCLVGWKVAYSVAQWVELLVVMMVVGLAEMMEMILVERMAAS